jgi:hypothetical protein
MSRQAAHETVLDYNVLFKKDYDDISIALVNLNTCLEIEWFIL